jgi:hypothetical protein
VYSNFVDDYEALQASCRDLRNKRLTDPDPETGGGVLRDRISKADCAQVKNALDAVQLTAPVCTTTRPSPAGALCADGETVARLFYDDHESGSPGWTESLDESRYTGQRWQVVTDFTASGTHAWQVNDELRAAARATGHPTSISSAPGRPDWDVEARPSFRARFLHRRRLRRWHG